MTEEERKQARSDAGKKGAAGRMKLPDWKAHQKAAGKARSKLSDMRVVGRRGWDTVCAKYGRKRALEKVRQYRLEHPTTHERQVAEILSGLGVAFEREAIIFPHSSNPLTVDFRLEGSRRIIEVNGRAHTSPFCNKGNPAGRAEKDAERIKRLTQRGWAVLVIDHRQIRSAEAAIKLWLDIKSEEG